MTSKGRSRSPRHLMLSGVGMALTASALVAAMSSGTMAAQADVPTPPLTVTTSVDHLAVAPAPCSSANVAVGLTNNGSKPIYGDAFITDGGLDLTAHVITSYLPPGYTFVENVRVKAPVGTAEGSHTISVKAGRSTAEVAVAVQKGDYGDNLARTATTSASSIYSNRPPCGAIDGNRNTDDWSLGVGWSDNTNSRFPDSWQMTFDKPTTVSRVDLYTVDNAALPASTQGLRDWDIQIPDGDGWRTIAEVRDNEVGMVSSTFESVTTTSIRVLCLAANGHYSRILEFEAYA